MTVLPVRSERNRINIDTVERGLVWSLSLLKKTISNSPDYSQWIKIGINLFQSFSTGTAPEVFIEIKLPIDKPIFLLNGSEIKSSIIPFTNQSISELISYKPSINPIIQNEPAWVETLEDYCYWCASEIIKKNYPEKKISLVVSLDESIPFIRITGSFELVASEFLNTESIVESLRESGVDPVSPAIAPSLDDFIWTKLKNSLKKGSNLDFVIDETKEEILLNSFTSLVDIDNKINAHKSEVNPHSQYLLLSDLYNQLKVIFEGSVNEDDVNKKITVTGGNTTGGITITDLAQAITTHENLLNPHPFYVDANELNTELLNYLRTNSIYENIKNIFQGGVVKNDTNKTIEIAASSGSSGSSQNPIPFRSNSYFDLGAFGQAVQVSTVNSTAFSVGMGRAILYDWKQPTEVNAARINIATASAGGFYRIALYRYENYLTEVIWQGEFSMTSQASPIRELTFPAFTIPKGIIGLAWTCSVFAGAVSGFSRVNALVLPFNATLGQIPVGFDFQLNQDFLYEPFKNNPLPLITVYSAGTNSFIFPQVQFRKS
jgi:hypothetical protein